MEKNYLSAIDKKVYLKTAQMISKKKSTHDCIGNLLIPYLAIAYDLPNVGNVFSTILKFIKVKSYLYLIFKIKIDNLNFTN